MNLIRQGAVFHCESVPSLSESATKPHFVVVISTNAAIKAGQIEVIGCTSTPVRADDPNNVELLTRATSPQASNRLDKETWAVCPWRIRCAASHLTPNGYRGYITARELEEIITKSKFHVLRLTMP